MSSAQPLICQGLPKETISIIPPVPSEVFKKRSARLRVLASGHAVRGYLEAMARLADVQLAALRVFPSSRKQYTIPAPSFNAASQGYGKMWQKGLQAIIADMQLVSLPTESQAALSRLKSAAPAALEFSARAILCGNYDSVDLAASPFIAAALQVYWTDLASRIKAEAVGRNDNCPICSSPPVAGVILSDRKLRYLCCSLCATQWYVPRLTCTNCGSTAGLSYLKIDGDDRGTRAEACSQCNTYLKLFYLENNPGAEAYADDLSTIALDLAISGWPYSRSGINFFLLPGQIGNDPNLEDSGFNSPRMTSHAC